MQSRLPPHPRRSTPTYPSIIVGGSCHKHYFLSLAGAGTGIIFVATKRVFRRDKSMLAATKFLSRQNYVCRYKISLSRQNVCGRSILLSRQKNEFCRDKLSLAGVTISIIFVATNTCLSRQKITFVATNIIHAQQKMSRQKTCFVKTNTCFVATKIMFVAAPANDILLLRQKMCFVPTKAVSGRSYHKYNFCRDKTRVCRDKTRLLSRDKYACRDIFVVVANELCSLRQNYASITFVATKDMFCRNKNDTCGSSRQ